MIKPYISPENDKMGPIPSISLPCGITCNPNAPCFKDCYANALSKRRTTVEKSWARNLKALNESRDVYFLTIKLAAFMTKFFRYHVGGDIPDMDYLIRMVELANDVKDTKFLCFTKQFPIVNRFMDEGGIKPDNLQIIFSNWGEWKCDNPYFFPTCEVVFKGHEPKPEWKICGGNCTECACRGIGCWELKKGETIAINKH